LQLIQPNHVATASLQRSETAQAHSRFARLLNQSSLLLVVFSVATASPTPLFLSDPVLIFQNNSPLPVKEPDYSRV